MGEIGNGGPASPTHGGNEGDDYRNRIVGGGMTLRDWFAGQALIGLLSRDHHSGAVALSGQAYVYADAMLSTRMEGK
jgi:hypothetical protein